MTVRRTARQRAASRRNLVKARRRRRAVKTVGVLAATGAVAYGAHRKVKGQFDFEHHRNATVNMVKYNRKVSVGKFDAGVKVKGKKHAARVRAAGFKGAGITKGVMFGANLPGGHAVRAQYRVGVKQRKQSKRQQRKEFNKILWEMGIDNSPRSSRRTTTISTAKIIIRGR